MPDLSPVPGFECRPQSFVLYPAGYVCRAAKKGIEMKISARNAIPARSSRSEGRHDGACADRHWRRHGRDGLHYQRVRRGTRPPVRRKAFAVIKASDVMVAIPE